MHAPAAVGACLAGPLAQPSAALPGLRPGRLDQFPDFRLGYPGKQRHERLKGGPRVAHQAQRRRVDPPQILRGRGEVDQPQFRRHRPGLPVPEAHESTRADEKDGVEPGQLRAGLLGVGGQRTSPQRVGRGEDERGMHRGPVDPAAQPLGHGDQRGRRPGVGHLVTRDHREARPRGSQDGRRQVGQGGGDGPPLDARRRGHRELALVLQHIHGNGNEHRPRGGRRRVVEGPTEHRAEVGGLVDLVGPLHQPGRHAGQVPGQERLRQQMTPVLLAGGHHYRRAGGPRVGQIPHGVAQAGHGVDVEEGRPPGGLRITVGHACRHGFVQSEHVVKSARPGQGVQQWQLGGSRVPEDMPHLLRLQDLEQDVGT